MTFLYLFKKINYNDLKIKEVIDMEYKSLKSIYYSDQKNYNDIYNNRLNSESTYNFRVDVKGNPAFSVITPNILKQVTEMLQKNRALEKLTEQLPPVAIGQYTLECLIEEIRLTNEIEGIHSTRREITDILDNAPNKNTRLEGLVNKYNLLNKETMPLKTCQDIRNIYDSLVLEEVIAADPKNKPDGQIFRLDKVHVQNELAKIIHTGVLGEENIIKYLDTCLDVLKDEDYNFFIKVAAFHYLFAYVHPFYDGNGRVNRFISSYLLGTQLHQLVSYRLAYTIKKSIDSYYKMFKDTNLDINKGDLTPFIEKFLDFIIKAIDDLQENLNEKCEELHFYVAQIESKFDDAKTKQLLFILVQNALFKEDGISKDELCENTILGDTTIRKILKELEEMNLIQKDRKGKKFVYRLLIDNIKVEEQR